MLVRPFHAFAARIADLRVQPLGTRLALGGAALILLSSMVIGLALIALVSLGVAAWYAELISVAFGMLLAPVAWRLLRNSLLPLQQLHARMQNPEQSMAMGGRNDDIGEMAVAFERLLRDLSDSRELVRLTHEQLHAVLDCSLDAFFIFDVIRDEVGKTSDFRLCYANRRAGTMLGQEPEQMVGKNLGQILPSARADGWFDRLAEAAAGRQSPQEEKQIRLSGASVQWVLYQTVPLANGVALTVRDISARKRDEVELRESRAFLQTLIEYLPVLIFAKSFRAENHDKMVVWNKTAEHVMGYSAEQVVGRRNHEIFPAKVADTLNALDRQMLADPRVVVIPEFPYRRPDGALRYLHSISVPLFGDEGKVDYIFGIVEDITVRRAQELLLRNQQAETTAVIDILPLGLFRTDAGGNVIYANKVFERMTGLDAEELSHYGWQRAVHQEDRQRVAEEWADALHHERPFQSKQRFVRSDGVTVWTAVKAELVRLAGETRGYVCMVEEIPKPSLKAVKTMPQPDLFG